MIKLTIVLKTDNIDEFPAIMQEIGEKINNKIIGANAPKYYFKTKEIDDVLEVFDDSIPQYLLDHMNMNR